MKILIINPNSNKEVTRSIYAMAKEYAQPGTELICECIEDGPAFIGSYKDQAMVGKAMVEMVEKYIRTNILGKEWS